LLLAGGFGLVCLFAPGRPLFSRALTTAALALIIVFGLSLRGPLSESKTRQAVQSEYERRNGETMTSFRDTWTQHPELAQSLRQIAVSPDTLEGRLKTMATAGT